MRPVTVVMIDVDTEHLLELWPTDDQDPVEAVTSDGADPALRKRVRFRGLEGCADHFNALAAEDLVEVVSELAVSVVDEEADRCRAARCTRRLPSSMKKSTYSRPSQSVSTVKKSQAIIVCACKPRNSRQQGRARAPAGGTPACRRILATVVAQTCTPRPAAPRRCAGTPTGDSHGRDAEQARAARLTPPADPGGARRRTKRLRTSSRCQCNKVSGRTKNDGPRLRSRLAAARNTRSASSRRGRTTWRRRTASSCRSTMISSSLNSRERKRSAATASARRKSRYTSETGKSRPSSTTISYGPKARRINC